MVSFRFQQRPVVASTANREQPAMPRPGAPMSMHAPIHVHDDAASHTAATARSAYAYTLGTDIYLGPGLGQPGMPSRDAVLRHEATHAAQTQQPGPYAPEDAVEQQAYAWNGREPLLSADPMQPHGLFWIPVIAGLYVLLRSSPANAPAPGQRTYPSLPWWQPALEAIAIFGIPGAAGISLARAGWTVVGVSAAEGSIASIGYRGVQDLAAGEFSGIEAYVVDAATGAVVGVVVGGVFQVWKGAKVRMGGSAGEGAGPATSATSGTEVVPPQGAVPNPLYHHTNALDAIESSGKVLGNTEGRVYTTAAGEIGGTGQRLATGVGSKVGQRVAFTGEAAEMFEPHPAEGWFSWYKRRGGQYVSRRVGYNLAFEANAAAREGNTLTISQAAWQRQAARRFMWSHARLWGRRLLVDWGMPAFLAWGLGEGYGAYSNYPTGRASQAGRNTTPAAATRPAAGSAEPMLPPLGAAGQAADAGLEPMLDLGPEFGLDMAPAAGLDAAQNPLTLSSFLPAQAEPETTSGTASNGADGGPRQVKIIYVDRYNMQAEDSVATYGYNAACPSCHTRTNQPRQPALSWEGESSSRSTLPNFLSTGPGLLGGDQRAALEAYMRLLQEQQ